jgi:hypothetical protein
MKVELEIVDVEVLKRKGIQVLSEEQTMNKLSRSSLNPKWHLEEIQNFEDLLQVKRLVLGNVKRIINVLVT